jgi:hypothetical protein
MEGALLGISDAAAYVYGWISIDFCPEGRNGRIDNTFKGRRMKLGGHRGHWTGCWMRTVWEEIMRKNFLVTLTLTVLCGSAFAIEQRHGILMGEILKLDAAAKTIVVKLADGSEHTLHLVKQTAVHGARGAAVAGTEAFHGLKEGSEVVVHYTAKGTRETANDIDAIGKDGLKATETTASHIDHGAKTLASKTANGAEETYHRTGGVAKEAGKDIAEGTTKSAKVTVHYAEAAGRKIAHLFKRT